MNDTDKGKWLDWRVECALLAKEITEDDAGGAFGETDAVELAEALQAVTTAYVIAHRVRPTPTQVTTVLNEYDGDRQLIGRALRTAADRDELNAAKRCEAWRKAAESGNASYNGYLRTAAQRWCEAQPEKARVQFERLDEADRRAALAALGWELDIATGDDGTADAE